MTRIKPTLCSQIGVSSWPVLIVLATISTTIVGLSLNRMYLNNLNKAKKQDHIAISLLQSSFLKESIFELIATGEPLLHTVESDSATFTLGYDISDASLNDKYVVYFSLFVKALSLEGLSTQDSVIFKQEKRLEVAPEKALSKWDKGNINETIQHYFKVDLDTFYSYANASALLVENCDSLPSTSVGLIWVKGNCEPSDSVIGDVDRPTLLVVEGSDITLQEVKFSGLIIHLYVGEASCSSSVNAKSTIKGSWISLCDSFIDSGQIQYDPKILSTLLSHNDNHIYRFIEGSWLRD